MNCTTQAIGHYEAAIGLDPTEITFRSNLAAVHFEMKNYEEVNHGFLSILIIFISYEELPMSFQNCSPSVCESMREGC